MNRPIIIEFSGLPNSGKTTLLAKVAQLCKANNISALIMQEPAELIPANIPKGSIAQTLYCTLETLKKSLEIKYTSDVDFILLDRGFYNQLFWATLYREKDPEYSEYVTYVMKKFNQMFSVRPDYLYIVDVSIEESIRRRMLTGNPVTFTKKEFLSNYRESFQHFCENIAPKLYIDTTNLTVDEEAKNVFEALLALKND